MNLEERSRITSELEVLSKPDSEELHALFSFDARAQEHIRKVAYLSKEEEYNLVRKEIAKRLFRSEISDQNYQAAAWRKRVQRQTAIDNELTKLGPLALLCSGGLLVAWRDNEVQRVKRQSRWRPTLIESPIFDQLDRYGKAHILRAEYEPYVRLELAINAIGQMICLSTTDLTDRELIAGFSDFKVWCINHAFKDEQSLDDVIQYIKWLAKAAQSVFLKAKVPDEPELRPVRQNGKIIPFVGKLSFVSSLIQSGRRREELTSLKARALAQIASTNRALPYPSTTQIRKSIKDTVEAFTSTKSVSQNALNVHRIGLDAIRHSIGETAGKRTHSSLVNKGTVECSRANGGRSAFLVAAARSATDLPLVEEMEVLVGRRDQFGNVLIDPTTWQLAWMLLANRQYNINPRLGDILYLQPEEISDQWDYALNKGKRVPLHLAQILNNIASKLVLSIGEYDKPHKIICGLLTFSKKLEPIRFKIGKTIPTKADVSIESGLKARLTTSQMAAVAHLAQLPSNTMRAYLSKDPFCRVGFEESEKLWEVLKQYGKENK
jgi:hypothetical protein